MEKEKIDDRQRPLTFSPLERTKYDVFLKWAKACGHYQVLKSAENFDKFVSSVEEVGRGPA